jgi:hypothetical protein
VIPAHAVTGSATPLTESGFPLSAKAEVSPVVSQGTSRKEIDGAIALSSSLPLTERDLNRVLVSLIWTVEKLVT